MYPIHQCSLMLVLILATTCATNGFGNHTVDLSTLKYDLYCKFQKNSYNCDRKKGSAVRYYYDVQIGECRKFRYRHCNNTYNVFNTRKECKSVCRDVVDEPLPKNLSSSVVCRLQYDFGECHRYNPMFYYDVSLASCEGFSWSGCGGNPNRFNSIKDCSVACNRAVYSIS